MDFEDRIESNESESLDGSLEKIGIYDHVGFYSGYYVKGENLPLNLCSTGVNTSIIALMGQIVNILTPEASCFAHNLLEVNSYNL